MHVLQLVVLRLLRALFALIAVARPVLQSGVSLDPSQLRPVLVIGADAEQRRRVVALIEGDGLEVVETGTASAAARVAHSADPSCIVVVGDPPGVDAELLQEWRRSGARCGIVVLGRPEHASRWRPVAEDWLPSPVVPEHLLARIRRHVDRRAPSRLALEAGDVDLKRRELARPDGVVRLTAREADLLAYFAAHPARTLGKDVLLREVWGWRPGLVTRAVDQAIRRLRDRIERDPAKPRHVLTVHGEGYRFEPLEDGRPTPSIGSDPAAEVSPGAAPGPARFGRYEVLGELGRGGSGVVLKAELVGPASFRKPVALKVLHGGPGRPEGLLDEARLGARLRHPNLVDVYDAGVVGGRAFVAMEWVDGVSVRQLLRTAGPLPPDAALELVEQAACGVGEAHAAGVVHLDLKPGNLLVSRLGAVKVADFGIARAPDRRGSPGAGTAGYVAPEAFDGLPGPRADVFALGVVLATAVLGKLPWAGGGLDEWRTALGGPVGLLGRWPLVELRLDEARPGLGPVVAACLSTDPAGRAADGRALAAQVAALIRNRGALAAIVARVLGVDPLPARPPAPPPLRPPRPGPDAFVGRSSELARLRGLFDAGARLVSIHGPGGMGKSRLAVAFASDPPPAGGAVVVDLEEAATPLGLFVAVARALGAILEAPDAAGQEKELARALAGSRSLLVVLDGVERCAADLGRVLRRWLVEAPDVRFLVTTRQRLAVPGEHVLGLGPLPREEAAALFLARARAVEPGLALDDAERRDLDRLVEALDNMPLAVELAAARARLGGIRSILERIEDRFRLLAGPPGQPARHATLRATLDSAIELLTEAEQAAFAQLSVFAGGFTVEAAEAVLDLSAFPQAPWALFVVEALLDRSLLRALPDGRLGMYLQLQAYAAATGDAAVLAGARERHARFYARRAASGPIELDNVLAGLRHAVAIPDPGLAVDLAEAAVDLLRDSGPIAAAEAPLAAALAVPGLDDAGRARLAARRAFVLRLLGRFDDALAAATRALEPPPADLRIELALRETVALCHRELGRPDLALTGLRALVRPARASGDPGALASILGNLAWIWRGQGRTDDEVSLTLVDALDLAERSGDARREGAILLELAMLRRMQGDVAEAERCYRLVVARCRELGDRSRLGYALNNLGNLQSGSGRTAEARLAWSEAAALFQRLGRPGPEAVSLASLASALAADGDADESRRCIARALAIAGDTVLVHQGTARKECARALRRLGDAAASRDELLRAEALFEEGGYDHALALSLCEHAELELEQGALDAARLLCERAGDLARALSAPDGGQLSNLLARIGRELAGAP